MAIEGEENTVCYLIREMADEMIMEDLMMQNDKLSVSGQLAAGIAHEVRNPLTSIKGFMQLIKRGELMESEHFDIINSEIKRIDFLLKELLTLARPQKPVFETIDLCSTIDHIVTLLNTQAILHNVILEKTFSHAHFWINADQNHMKQIFINFIKNAIEAMPTGGCVQLSLKKVMGNQVEVTIRDQGEGIPACVLKNIGQLFLTTKEDGIGLGLVVSMNLIKQNNGLIHIDSNDHGTSIKVRFPLVQES